ncbi:hypothetical protein C8Q72DRAFT_936181 [Fomitopsis betulina]|nr:hypothetical protein C8Q72DRAFT_936181 [Fomitopsis betulina]
MEELDAPAMDLSGYDLSTEQVVQLLASHPTGVAVLNLCFNERIAASSIPKVLAVAPSVRRLVIIGCVSIEETELSDMLWTKPELFFQLEALIHPSLMRLKEPLTQPITFTVACSSGDNMWQGRFGSCLPIFTPMSVVQSLIDFTDFYARLPRHGFEFDGCMAIHASFTVTRKVDERFDRRSFIAVPYFPEVPMLPGHPGRPPPRWTCIFRYDTDESGSSMHYAFLKYSHGSSASEASTRSFSSETLHEEPGATKEEDCESTGKGQYDTMSNNAIGDKDMDATGDKGFIAGVKKPDTNMTSELTHNSLALEAFDLHDFIVNLMAEGQPPISEDLVAKLSQSVLSENESMRHRAEANNAGESEHVLYMTQVEIDCFTQQMVQEARWRRDLA